MRMNNKSATIRTHVPQSDLMLSGSRGSGIKQRGRETYKNIKKSEWSDRDETEWEGGLKETRRESRFFCPKH